MGVSPNSLDMKCFAALCLLGVALSAPAPQDAAAPVVLPYGYGLGAYPYAAAGLPYAGLHHAGLPYAGLHHAGLPYAGVPHVYHALNSGLVYPLAEPYVHDPAGDVAVVAADDASPEAPAYVHDTTGDVAVE